MFLIACSTPETTTVSPPPKHEPITEGSPRLKDAGCSTIVKAFDRLVATGCSLPASATPYTLRALRNTPFAARGRAFKSAELQAFFAADVCGANPSWYRPRPGLQPELPPAEAACVQQLHALEQQRRKSLGLHKEIEPLLFTQGHAALSEEARLISGAVEPYRFEVEIDGKNAVSFGWIFGGADGQSESGVGVRCEPDCQFWAAG